MVTVSMIPLSFNLLISLFGGKNIDYKPAFIYFDGVLLILTRLVQYSFTKVFTTVSLL